MKRMLLFLLTVVLTLGMCGCGHKSDVELVDVEQFRCQDSIETVFEVLGEAEIQEKELLSGTNYYYEYEDVVLWGKRGTLTFYVRNDKSTIKYFEGKITLNDNESLELLSLFTDKYGAYEIENIMNVNENYVWKISMENGEVGYKEGEMAVDKIVVSIKGAYKEESEHKLTFSDEWSYVTDELYFEALEESQNPQSNWETMVSQNYEYDGVTMNLTFSKDEEGLFHFSIGLNVEEKWKAAGIYTYVKLLVNVLNEQLEDKGISSFVTMICGDDVISSEVSFAANGEESELIDDGTWLIDGYQDENFDADECEQLWEQIEDDIYYFLMGDEYSKYKNN